MKKSIGKKDKIKIIGMALYFKLFQNLLKKIYIKRGLWSESGPKLSIFFFIKNGGGLIGKFSSLLRENGYPKVDQDFENLSEKLRSGYSLSRFGDGEYAIIKSKLEQKVYFDTVTQRAQQQLLEVLKVPVPKHMLGVIHEDVVASQLSFSNTLSMFKKLISFNGSPRMPILSEYDTDMLEVYSLLCTRSNIFEAGLLRNSSHKQQIEIWKGRDVLYVTGSMKTSLEYGYSVEDIFQEAASLEIIETVTEQALSRHYDEILQQVILHQNLKSKVILISQGMAGSVLAYDLAKLGFHAIDFGQPFVNYK